VEPGGSAGAVVERYVSEGARVAVFDLLKERLQELKGQLGDNVVTSAGDVRSSQDNVEAVEECVHALAAWTSS
jgi:NADP-dependent 3-hydroxy acid dehydrogenase YdfG